MQQVEIGVFAHNEENTIEMLLGDLARQSIISNLETEVRISILCNGCSDSTVSIARRSVTKIGGLCKTTTIYDYGEAGKSRTWNRFVENINNRSQYIIFMDADIRINDVDALLNLVIELQQNNTVAVTSRPIKNTHHLRWNPILRTATILTARSHKNGPIAGHLYIVKADAVKNIYLPVPCLVEDGFLSACFITGLFSHQGRPQLVKASRYVSHFFNTPGSLREFFYHDVRLALGCELNAALYSELWAANSIEKKQKLLYRFAHSSGIDRAINEHLVHQERSALKSKIDYYELIGNKKDSLFKRLLRFPFSILHYFYMSAVYYRARGLFEDRKFQW